MFAGYEIKTYLMGYTYDTEYNEDEDEDDEIENRLIKMKLQEERDAKKKAAEQ